MGGVWWGRGSVRGAGPIEGMRAWRGAQQQPARARRLLPTAPRPLPRPPQIITGLRPSRGNMRMPEVRGGAQGRRSVARARPAVPGLETRPRPCRLATPPSARCPQVPEECPQEVCDLMMEVGGARWQIEDWMDGGPEWMEGSLRVAHADAGRPPASARCWAAPWQPRPRCCHCLLPTTSSRRVARALFPASHLPQCLSEDPAERPTAGQLLQRLHALMERRPAERRAMGAGPSAQSPSPDFQAYVAGQQ